MNAAPPLSTREAAALLGVSDVTVRRAIYDRRMHAYRVRSAWKIERTEVDRVRAGVTGGERSPTP